MKLFEAVKKLKDAGFNVHVDCLTDDGPTVMAFVSFEYRVHGSGPHTASCFTLPVSARIDAPRFHGHFAEAIAKRHLRKREYDDALAAEAERHANRPVARSQAQEVV